MCHCYPAPAPAPAPAPVSNGGQGEKCVHAAFCVTINYTDPHLSSGLLITAVNGNSRKLWKKKHLKNLLRIKTHYAKINFAHNFRWSLFVDTHVQHSVLYQGEGPNYGLLRILRSLVDCSFCLLSRTTYSAGHSAVLHKKNLQKSSLMWLVEPSLHDCTKCQCGINMLTAPGLHS